MKNQILFIGVDVDDKSYHLSGITEDGKTDYDFHCKPTLGALLGKLRSLEEQHKLKVCYEATYIGFSLSRELRSHGIDCEVIAPSLVPFKPGDRVKTDKLDAYKLARYYRSDDLTIVRLPTEEEETIRDVVRSRGFLKNQVKETKLHILSLCRRFGLRYKEPDKGMSYWTVPHLRWLESQCKKAKTQALKFNLRNLIDTLKLLEGQKDKYDDEIMRITTQPEYKTKVQALRCYRGIDTLTAMTLVTEIGDINRFSHPKQMASYAGMDIRETSSGGHEKKYCITKMGNKHIRTAVIEATQSVFETPRVSKRLKAQREKTEEKYINIADRCMKRLNKKSTRLLYAGKAKNKIKVAAARELLCFVWESLKAVA